MRRHQWCSCHPGRVEVLLLQPGSLCSSEGFHFRRCSSLLFQSQSTRIREPRSDTGKVVQYKGKIAPTVRRSDVQRFQPSKFRYTQCRCWEPNNGLELEHPGRETNARCAEANLLDSYYAENDTCYPPGDRVHKWNCERGRLCGSSRSKRFNHFLVDACSAQYKRDLSKAEELTLMYFSGLLGEQQR